LARSRARSALVITNAPPPSVTRHESSRCKGEHWIGDASTSSTVSGSWNRARGFIVAHSLVLTAMLANCSDVVPYTAM
jgi:hypothetical protein